jgi:hypothetical protein
MRTQAMPTRPLRILLPVIALLVSLQGTSAQQGRTKTISVTGTVSEFRAGKSIVLNADDGSVMTLRITRKTKFTDSKGRAIVSIPPGSHVTVGVRRASRPTLTDDAALWAAIRNRTDQR